MDGFSIWHIFSLITLITIVLIIKFILSILRRSNAQDEDGEISKRFSGNIPSGYQIYIGNVSLAGIKFHKTDVIHFIKGENHSIELVRDPTNKYDANAIKVMGVSSGRKYHIGFIPADLAKELVNKGFDDKILARLTNLHLGNTGYINIEYDLLLPRELVKLSNALDLKEPIDQDQKDFLEYFDQPVSEGMSTGQADKIIKEFTVKMDRDQPGKIEEYESFKNIISDLNDEDELYNYSLKKPPKKIIEQALGQLKEGGLSYEQIYDDMQLLADKIIEIRPDLETKY